MACTATTNPVKIPIQPKRILTIACTANGEFTQEATLSFSADMSNPIGRFVGEGENLPMRLPNGDVNLVQPTAGDTALFAEFRFARGENPFQAAARVCAPAINGRFTTVNSDDTTDNDDNNSRLMIFSSDEESKAEY
jgi:hypothetical protein